MCSVLGIIAYSVLVTVMCSVLGIIAYSELVTVMCARHYSI